LFALNPGPPGGTSEGSGFIVNNLGFVVTARHIIPPGGQIAVLVQIPASDRVRFYEDFAFSIATLIAEDDRHDIAVVRMERNPFQQTLTVWHTPSTEFRVQVGVATIDGARVRDGDGIFMPGYPLDRASLTTTTGIIAGSDPFLDQTDPERSTLDDNYVADIVGNLGNSGGPVFSISGAAVIGIQTDVSRSAAVLDLMDHPHASAGGTVVMKTRDGWVPGPPDLIVANTGLVRISPAAYIVSLLRSHGIAFTAR
jgi:S1-C subfamily serine protease